MLNVSEVASNVPLLRWPLRQGYLETPLCVWLLCRLVHTDTFRTTRAGEVPEEEVVRSAEDDD